MFSIYEFLDYRLADSFLTAPNLCHDAGLLDAEEIYKNQSVIGSAASNLFILDEAPSCSVDAAHASSSGSAIGMGLELKPSATIEALHIMESSTEKLQMRTKTFQSERQRLLYCLAVVDEAGVPVRAATVEEVEDLGRTVYNPTTPVTVTTGACETAAAATMVSDTAAVEPVVRGQVSQACSSPHKAGGPYDHCEATESPQWRRGPPGKPVLCNACGTRYRRSHQLGSNNGQAAKAAAATRHSGVQPIMQVPCPAAATGTEAEAPARELVGRCSTRRPLIDVTLQPDDSMWNKRVHENLRSAKRAKHIQLA
mmetsp:Transcript_16045/g.34680  ORF Transcript_16045/g.34680 Transcript_16045/m.34680 type:complete len:311 (-) Transcript_16045:1144-2076(-)